MYYVAGGILFCNRRCAGRCAGVFCSRGYAGIFCNRRYVGRCILYQGGMQVYSVTGGM